jgi:hypothetical protein
VVAHLVGDHVGLREITWGAEARLQVAEEREVDVEFLVTGTVKQGHRRI